MKLNWLGVLIWLIASNIVWGELRWSEQNYDFQAKNTDFEVVKDFYFTNSSTNTISITNLTTSCGCTLAELKKWVYQPGETGLVHVLFQFAYRMGLQKKQIFIQTDEPGVPPTILHLNVSIPEIVQITPEILLWTNIEGSIAQILRVMTTNQPDITIKEIINSNPKAFEITPLIQTNHLYEWSVKPIDPSKSVKTYFYLQADINGSQRAFRVVAEIKLPSNSLSSNDRHNPGSVSDQK